jgi:hypothetical protein
MANGSNFSSACTRIGPRGLCWYDKTIDLALGVLPDGTRDILGLWIDNTEGAKFWMKVFNDLKTRGVADILIAVTDGLKGMPEALAAVFPATTLQTCIVHLMRNITADWGRAAPHWKEAMNQFAILYEERFTHAHDTLHAGAQQCMRTTRVASGGLAGASIPSSQNQSTANSANGLAHRNSDTPDRLTPSDWNAHHAAMQSLRWWANKKSRPKAAQSNTG